MKITSIEQLLEHAHVDDRLAFADFIGKIERKNFMDGSVLKCCGMSLQHIVNNFPNVELIRYVYK